MTETILHQQHDDSMKLAITKAKRNFKYYWRELSWESRRIIPGLEMNAVKVAIQTDSAGSDVPPYEHMWFENIEFDGCLMSGDLLNEPSWVKTMGKGDRVDFKLDDISDWMYVMEECVYGGFTINEMRMRMSKNELKQHDSAWGLNFGDPKKVVVVPRAKESKGFLDIFRGNTGYCDGDNIPEHPMSLNMAEKCEDGIKDDPGPFIEPNEDGSTMLHFDALAGNLTQVRILLKYGANKSLKNKAGKTPKELALILNWNKVADIL